MSTHSATNGTYASSAKPSTALFAAAKNFPYVLSGISETFQYTPIPANLRGRQILSAHLEVSMGYDGGVGTRTVSAQRHAKPASSGYPGLTWNNRPGVLPGSTAKTVTQPIAQQQRIFDVTDDLQAIANGGAYYGWLITTTYLTHSWAVYGVSSILPIRLVVELAEYPVTPVGVSPNGTTSLAAPVVTWQTPPGLIAAQVQVDVVDGDFTTPVFDTGIVSTTVGQVDLAAQGWSGQANGGSVDIRVMQTTVLGNSQWSDPVTVTRANLPVLTITSPAAGTTDPTPAVVWSLAGQTRWQVIVYTGGKVIYNTGVRAGDDTAFTPPKGATRNGQVLTCEVRGWDGTDRTPSPGDPGYSTATQDTTYNPGVAAAVTSLAAYQVGRAPWVELAFARAALPDEWLIIRDREIIDRIPAVVSGDPVWTYVDWTCPPNTDVDYAVRPIENNATGASIGAIPHRSVVTGAWLFDPDNGRHFRCHGSDLSLAFVDNSVFYEPVGGTAAIKRTFGMRGIEGTIAGRLDDAGNRTLTEQMADFWAIKGAPSKTYRVAYDDVNIPVVVSDLNPSPHTALTTTKQVQKVVSYAIRQNGELPFEPVAL